MWPQEVGEVNTGLFFDGEEMVPGLALSWLEPWDFVLWSHLGKSLGNLTY